MTIEITVYNTDKAFKTTQLSSTCKYLQQTQQQGHWSKHTGTHVLGSRHYLLFTKVCISNVAPLFSAFNKLSVKKDSYLLVGRPLASSMLLRQCTSLEHSSICFNYDIKITVSDAALWKNNECVLFQNLTNLDRSERNAPYSQSNLICSDTSEKIWFSHAHLCCRASALSVYL